MRKAGIATLLLLPVVFLTVYFAQEPQTIEQFAQVAPGADDPTAPGPVCDPNTVLPPAQRTILEEVCKIDHATDACKDFCKRTERPESDCAPGGPFGPPPPPPVVEQPKNGGGETGGGGGRGGGGDRGDDPAKGVKSPGTKRNTNTCVRNQDCASGFCNYSAGGKCSPASNSRAGKSGVGTSFCALNPNHARCKTQPGLGCPTGSYYKIGGVPGTGYCKKLN